MTLFEKIVQGEIPAYKVAENENYLAFLDIFPLKKGHTLVIPKKPTDYIFDLADNELAGLHLFAKKVAQAIEQVVSCKRVGMAVIGLEVPHAHIHLIPIENEGDVNFSNPKLKFTESEMIEIAQSISQKITSPS